MVTFLVPLFFLKKYPFWPILDSVLKVKQKSCVQTTDQDFIEALLLTSVFHKGLSFKVASHNPTCISVLTLLNGGLSHHVFKQPFHASFADLTFSFFRSFLYLYKLFTPMIPPKSKNKNKSSSLQVV